MPSTILSDNGVSSGSAGLKTTAASDGALVLQTSTSGGTATNAVYIDTAQNVGVGVTPSAWGSNYRALQVGYGGSVSAGNGTFPSYVSMGANYYIDSASAARYLQTAASSSYSQNGGVHAWYTAASGTAGNAITFTQSLAVGKGTTLALEGATSVSGTGISFPATQSASTDANTLDDYEEGTFTPTLTNAGTYSTQIGRYVKIGSHVTVIINILTTGFTNTGSTGISIGGLPFTSVNVAGLYSVSVPFQIQGFNQANQNLRAQANYNGTTAALYTVSSSTGINYTTVVANTFGTTVEFEMTLTYFTA